MNLTFSFISHKHGLRKAQTEKQQNIWVYTSLQMLSDWTNHKIAKYKSWVYLGNIVLQCHQNATADNATHYESDKRLWL